MLDHRHFPTDSPVLRSNSDSRALTACLLALIVASEYKFRLRDQDQSVSGNPDVFVLLEIATYAVVACWLFVHFRPAPRLHTAHWVTLTAYAYVATLWLSTTYSPYFEMALVRSWQMAVLLAATRSVVRHSGRATMHLFAHSYCVLVSASVVFGALVPLPRRESQADRFTWLYLHPVTAGQFLAIAVVVLVGYVLGRRNTHTGPSWPLPVYLGMLLICTVGLVATNTRGAALGALVGSLTALWVRWRGTRRLEITAFLSVGLLAIGLAATPLITAFFTRGHSMSRLFTLNSRTELWGYALEEFFERPLYGHGQSATRGLFLDEMGLGGGHNAVINLMVNSGLLGLVVWSALVFGILLNTARAARSSPEPRQDRILVYAVLVGMLANSVFTESLGAPSNVAAVWLFVLAAWSELIRPPGRERELVPGQRA
ncbi:O-antigen ligase family protein [Actinopolyspora saharensis]|uniref:O-antigen ligase n=1 Tax=Actinopolyspora saharensis TaxID=995062 RepID=A0A1H1CZT7_9ACTN|nr:O-antigen ligase family protein [Actinopolyspora saharensis]SDQ69734.1 O-antigen ligase [Actinopolyspora saharensis]